MRGGWTLQAVCRLENAKTLNNEYKRKRMSGCSSGKKNFIQIYIYIYKKVVKGKLNLNQKHATGSPDC